MATQVIGYPMVNAGALYINGMRLAWVDADNITVSAGACRDGTNQNDIILSEAVTVDATNNGINGLDQGALANNTFYAVYAVGSSLSADPETNITQQNLYTGNGTFTIQPAPMWSVKNNPQPGVMLSTSLTGPILPLNYDMSRRIGFVLTDGAANILEFWQEGSGSDRTMYYATAIQELAGGVSAVYAEVDLATSVPLTAAGGSSTSVIFLVALTPTAADDTVNLKPVNSASVNGIAIMSGDVAAVVHTDLITCPAAVDAGVLKIEYKVTGAVTLSTAGYVDQL